MLSTWLFAFKSDGRASATCLEHEVHTPVCTAQGGGGSFKDREPQNTRKTQCSRLPDFFVNLHLLSSNSVHL